MRKTRTLTRAAALAATLLALAATGCRRIDANAALGEAVEHAVAGRWSETLALTERVVDRTPRNVDALVLHGLAQHYAQRTHEAVYTLERATNLAPEQFFPNYFLGWVLCEAQRYADAMPPLRVAYRQYRDHPQVAPDLFILLARCALEQNLPDGIGHLQALRRFRNFDRAPELHNALGMLWLAQGNYADARESFLEARKHGGAAQGRVNAVVSQNLAVLHDYYLHQNDAAMRYYRESLWAAQGTHDLGEQQVRVTARLRELARETRRPAPDGPAN